MSTPPRYVPDLELPPYSHVPGRRPHPQRHPDGHGLGPDPDDIPAVTDLRQWRSDRVYLSGIDLFNHGYYWESHEMWEALWHRTGDDVSAALFLKGLIKLAAAGVKIREGNPHGAMKHAERAKKSFQHIREVEDEHEMGGLPVEKLLAFCNHIEQIAGDIIPRPDLPAEIVFDRFLLP